MALVGRATGGGHSAADCDCRKIERLAEHSIGQLPDGRGGCDRAVDGFGVLHAEPARKHAAVASTKGDRRCANAMLLAQVCDKGRPVAERLCGRAVGKAALCALAAEIRVRERLVAMLSENEQRAELLSQLPHEARVVNILLNRALVAGVEEDGARCFGWRVKAAVVRGPPPVGVDAVTLREGAFCIAKVVEPLLERAPGTVDDRRSGGRSHCLAPASDWARARRADREERREEHGCAVCRKDEVCRTVEPQLRKKDRNG
eukprot:281931-Prymnesium_polylepis.1